MERNEEREDKKAENLKKRRERRRQRLLEKTAEERENRLAKRREAWKKRTAEVKGKQKEFQRAYRQQKEAAESTEERESRLAKRREVLQERTTEAKGKEKVNKRVCRQQKKAAESAEERETRLEKRRKAWQEKTGEAKGKEKEYQRAHYVDKKQNETEAERTNRLQKIREKRASKILDEEGMSVHEAGCPVVSRNEYLHQGGWQNVDNPLHEQEFVLNEMHSFHLEQEHLEHRQCIVCKEAWPTRQNLTSEVYICYRCKRDKKSPKKFSAENDMDPGVVPEQLRGLTQVEEMLISRVCPIMRVYRKHGGQRGYQRHVLNLPQDIQSFLNRLPSRVADFPVTVVRRHGADDTHRDFTVRRHKVLEVV